MKRIIFILAILLATLFLIVQAESVVFISGTSGGAACSTSISDDFSGTLSKWTLLGSGSAWTIQSGRISTINNASVVLYTDEETCTVTQWMMASFGGQSGGGSMYAGFYLRSENDQTTYAYAVRYEEATTRFAWRYCGGAANSNTAASCTTIATWTRTLDDDDFVGVEVSGTGTGTEVKIYDLGTTAKQHANWASSADASTTLTTDPAQAADVGKYIGFYNGSTTLSDFDDLTGE